MTRDTLKQLYIRLNGLRDRFPKRRYFFERQGEMIRVAFKVEDRTLGLVRYMPPIEMMRWLEGCVYGFNSCWYNTTGD